MEGQQKKTGIGFSSYRNNIILSYILIGACTLGVSLSAYFISNDIKLNNERITELALIEKHQLSLINSIEEASLHLNAYLQNGQEIHAIALANTWSAGFYEKKRSVDQFAFHNLDSRSRRIVRENNKLIESIAGLQKSNAKRINDLLVEKNFYNNKSDSYLSGIYWNTQSRLNDELLPMILQLRENTVIITQDLASLREEVKSELAGLYVKLSSLAILFFVLAIIFGSVFGFKLIPSLLNNLLIIKNVSKTLGHGNIPEKMKENSNETNLIIREINLLIENLVNIKLLAANVSEGKFDTDVTVFNNEGELGTSLANMRTSLSKVAMEERHRDWINQGISQFGDILRKNSEHIADLCEEVVFSMVKYVEANQGAIYLLEEENTENAHMKMMACYAYKRKKKAKLSLARGQGLVGQAWQEKSTIFLTDIPEDFVKIKSGLGGQTPKCLLVVPLTNNEEVVGILEIASFREFAEHEVAFIEKVCESIGASISTTRNNEMTRELFEESKQMTEEMKAQEEEMRQNMEELQATQEEMNRAQVEIKKKEFNLNALINNTADTIFAINTNYEITVVNKVLYDKYKGFGVELKEGTNIVDLLSGEAKAKWKMRYDRALAGERFTLIEESSGSNGERFSETFHNPIRDEQGNVIGVSVISRDVTEMVKSKKETERKQSILNALLNNTEDTYFALDKSYNILVVNKALHDRFAKMGIEMTEGMNIFDVLPPQDHEGWKERYDRALAGESFIIPQERKVNEKTLYIEGHYNPVLNEKGEIIGASVMSKDITQYKDALVLKEENEMEISKLRATLGLAKKSKIDLN